MPHGVVCICIHSKSCICRAIPWQFAQPLFCSQSILGSAPQHDTAGASSISHAASDAVPDLQQGRCLQLLPSQQAVLEALLQAISRGWMCILVGASGCGKSSIARTAAQLAGRHLTELALTGGTDTADLLGGFEQLEPKRKIQVCAKLDDFWCMFVPLTKHVGCGSQLVSNTV